MHRIVICCFAFTLSVFANNLANSAEPRYLALAPIPVAKDGEQKSRSGRMISILDERVTKLKANGKEKEAKAAIARAHQRVRDSEEQWNSQKDKIHDVVEKIGKGDDVDLDKTQLPIFQKEIRRLQKAAKRLIKDGKQDEAHKRADEMHKKVREAMNQKTADFARLHEEIKAVEKKEVAAHPTNDDKHEDGHHAGDEDHDGHHDAEDHDEHGKHGKDGRDGDDGHDGEDGHHGADGHDGEHGTDHHGAHDGHGHDQDDSHGEAEHAHGEADHSHGEADHPHGHPGELQELHVEIEEIRDEIKEIRDLIRRLRHKLR